MNEKMDGYELFPPPFPGAHLSFPELISSLAPSGNGEKEGIFRISGLEEPNVLGQAPGGGCFGKAVVLKQI